MTDMQMKFSEVESRRFGLRICRASFDEFDANAIVAGVFEERPDVVILRFPVEQLKSASDLDEIGMPWFIGDVHVCYEVDLTRYKPKAPVVEDLKFIEYTDENSSVVDRLIPVIFEGYENHYCMNPILEASLSDIYGEWAKTFIRGRSDKKSGWILEKGGSAVGFVVCEFNEDEGEIVLGGVTPAGRGGGVYRDFIRFGQAACLNAGCKKVKCTTQLWNKIVQKVWVGEGLVLEKSLMTLHINSLLHTTGVGLMDFQNNEVVREYAKVSVATLIDETRCIRDVLKLSQASLEEMINFLVLMYIPKILAGKNFRITGCRSKVYRDLSLEKEVFMEVTVPVYKKREGTAISVVKICDQSRVPAFLGYYKLRGR